ncbi:MAG: ImmA/IrrE family metallo-endopeptidase, partial [Christensenella sp.]|uniref:ImmA/IrrE family metallo-endopeptidase n=1 Tax=Christensenella sp. TaxID=1935934 RepID=UPI002B218D6C
SIMLTRPNVEENEANRFAAHLLIPDELLLEYRDFGFSISQVASDLGLPVNILELKLADCRI